MSRAGLIARWAGVAAVAAVAWYAAERLYLAPARAIQREISQARGRIAGVEGVLRGRADLPARIESLGARMIAGEPDEVEHRLRAGLAEVARRARLSDVSLGNGGPTPQRSPVRDSGPLGKALRSRADFEVIRGWMTGIGTLEDVHSCLAILGAQVWVHRIEGFSVTPVDPERERLRLRVDFATAVMSEVPRGIDEPWAIAEPGEGAMRAVAAVVGADLFGGRASTPDGAVVEAPVATDAYACWRVTGLIEGGGVEALLVNTLTGERAVLRPGERVLDAVFEGGSGERVVFSFDGELLVVAVGRAMDERRAISREEFGSVMQASVGEGQR